MPQGPLFQKVTCSWRFGPSVLRKFSLGVLAPDVEPLHGGGHTGLDEPLNRLDALSFNDR